MAFNIQRARGTLLGRAKQVRAEGIDVRTGGQQVGRAIAGLGWSIADLGQKYYNVQANTQLSQAKRIAVEQINKMSLSFEGNLDPETYEKEYEKTLESIRKSTGKVLTNKMATYEFGLFLNDRQPRWENSVKKAQRARITENAEEELFKQLGVIEETGNLGNFPKLLAGFVSEGVIDRSDGVLLLRRAKKLAAAGAELNMLNTYHEAAQKMPYNQAIQFLNDAPNLTRENRNDLIARRKRQEEIETATTNPETYWKLLRRVTADPKGITEPEIAAAVGKGITTDDYKELVRIQESKADPLKTPRAQIYLKHLEDLYKNKDIETVSDYDAKNEPNSLRRIQMQIPSKQQNFITAL
jgi:hypothetical protein